jgi:membrane-bound lytic murein transglycosylase F
LTFLGFANLLLGFALWQAPSVEKRNRDEADGARDTSYDFTLSVEQDSRVTVIDSIRAVPTDVVAHRGDLPHILQRGVLRVIVPTLDDDGLARRGLHFAAERELAAKFAEELGVELELVVVRNHDELIPAIEKGYGDIVAAQLTATPERKNRVAFTHPLATVDEWLVGSKGIEKPPHSVEDLAGRDIHVRRSSSYHQTLTALNNDHELNLNIVSVEESLDTESVVFEVSEGKRPFTVADSHLLEFIETYNEGVERLFVLSVGRELGWAVRQDNPELRSVADAFLVARFVTAHRDEPSTGDLDDIKRRGSIRVLTRNNPVNYFLYRGQSMGFDYELARLAARQLDVRLEMIVPPREDLLVPWLLEGRGDVIASSFAITPEHRKVVEFSRPYLYADVVVVQPKGGAVPLRAPGDLRGKRIHVKRSSSDYERLVSLREEVGPFEIVEASEDLETCQLIGLVGDGLIPLTVADSHFLRAETARRDDVEAAFRLGRGRSSEDGEKAIAFGIRRDNPDLKAFFDRFVKDSYRGVEYNLARQRYFGPQPSVGVETLPPSSDEDVLSPYDDIIKKYARRFRLDWRLLAAQAFQESRFEPGAKSWSGARGLFQIMPRTALELGLRDVEHPETGIHAGVKYMSDLVSRFESKVPLKHRVRFALAAYNAGWGHLRDARRLAMQQGWDPNKWFGHTEKAILLLEHPSFYRRTRHGYCRGSETVKYVSQIQLRYDHYAALVPE